MEKERADCMRIPALRKKEVRSNNKRSNSWIKSFISRIVKRRFIGKEE